MGVMVAKIKPANMKIFKGFSITTFPKNVNFRLTVARHNMTKTRNKIPAKISDFTVYRILGLENSVHKL
jgi:hypothetical protein